MPQPDFGLTLDVALDLWATEAGGLAAPIVTGFRPLCNIGGPGGPIIIGLCELRLDQPIAPGESGVGRLAFDVLVASEVRALLRVGSRFVLADGRNEIADAEVRGIEP